MHPASCEGDNVLFLRPSPPRHFFILWQISIQICCAASGHTQFLFIQVVRHRTAGDIYSDCSKSIAGTIPTALQRELSKKMEYSIIVSISESQHKSSWKANARFDNITY